MAKRSSRERSAKRESSLAVIVVVYLVVALVYGSLLSAPPLTWDDGVNIFENPYFRFGSWMTLWRTPYFGMYIPVTETIWAAVFHVGDGAAWPFRMLNISLHFANIALFAVLLRGLFRRFEIHNEAAFATGVAIFALHPQQTAVVSWISGSRDLASTAFALGAVLVLFRRSRFGDFWATMLFVAGLLSKPQIAGVPLAILLYVWLFDHERLKRTSMVIAGWLLLVFASAAITAVAQANDVQAVHVSLMRRPAVALDALGFYAMKAIWPFPLAEDYGRTPGYVWANPSSMALMIGISISCGVALWLAARRNRVYAIGFVWPLLLLPVLGLATFGYQNVSTVADHYAYMSLAVIGILASIAAANRTPRKRMWVWGIPALIISVGGFTSWRRTGIWRDDDRYYADMLAKNPSSYSAQLNLGASACDRGEWRAGLALVDRASAHGADDPGVLANKAYCLFRGERLDEVVRLQDNLLRADVREKLAKNQRAASLFAEVVGRAFDREGFPMRAFAYFCQANALTPENVNVAKMIASIHQQMSNAGRDVACPGLLGWDRLVAVVSNLE